MCDRECLCKKCKYGPCGICKHWEKVINQCRYDGVKECKKFKGRKEKYK